VAFADITQRIAAILEENKATLVAGLGDDKLDILAQYPVDPYAQRCIYVWREALDSVDYGRISGAGTGSSAGGEIDGIGDWRIGVFVRVPGGEGQAAEELDILAWNLLVVLRGYTADPQHTYSTLIVRGSTASQLDARKGWYLGENFRISVRWSMEF